MEILKTKVPGAVRGLCSFLKVETKTGLRASGFSGIREGTSLLEEGRVLSVSTARGRKPPA
jgi:hypothetical protein